MSKQLKRYRQISITESFSLSKKQKSNLIEASEMDRKFNSEPHVRELLATAAEKRIASSAGNVKYLKDVNSITAVTIDNKDQFVCSSSTQPSPSSKSGNDVQNSYYSQEIFKSTPNSDEMFPDISLSDENVVVPCTPIVDDKLSISNSAQSVDLFPEILENDDAKKITISYPSFSGAVEVPLSKLNRSPECCLPLPKLTPSENHSIMFSPHIRVGDAPRPYPSEYRDRWDSDHVRMPCSPQNKYPVEDQNGEKQIQSRWELICQSLRSNIRSSIELEQAILKYNSQYVGKWDFRGLHAFLNTCLRREQQEYFFDTILPTMIRMALQLPNICTQPVPLLKTHKDHSITLSQKQIGCLLLNAFFCTFPRRNLPSRRNRQRPSCEYASYPDINFNRLFAGTKKGITQRNAEKLKCLINYFARITEKEPSGTVTFHRQYLQNLPNWNASASKLKTVEVRSNGVIETEGSGMLQIDFANKFIGGGVLGYGCVQEEIRFVICPELIIARLFTECLDATEVLKIIGVEQYNKYSGYGDEFTWEGDFRDQVPRDAWGRRCTQLVAMDAVHFFTPEDQFKVTQIRRELNKAFCGFYEDASPENLPAVATGNWGCGVYNGYPTLKFLIQLMAASQAGRGMLYFTFGSKKLQRDLENMYKFLDSRDLTVGNIWKLLEDYSLHIMQFKKAQLYDYIYCANSRDDNSEKEAVRKLLEDVAFSEGSSTENDDIETNPSNDPV